MALCLSIFLEAIQRFVEPQVVSNPKLVLIVGCCGLGSNVLGLFLFHDHGHSHGGSSHSHGSEDDGGISAAEEGYAHYDNEDTHTKAMADERGNVADILPESAIGGWPHSTRAAPEHAKKDRKSSFKGFTKSDEDDSTAAGTTSPLSVRRSNTNSTSHRHGRHTSGSRQRYGSVDDIHVHPASFRNEIIAASRLEDIESGTGSESDSSEEVVDGDHDRLEGSPLLKKPMDQSTRKRKSSDAHKHVSPARHNSWHMSHNHNQPKKEEGHTGHSHSDLNMRGVFLHVMGDALGNIGVIASALFIWLTNYSWRYYTDPAISLVITIIILGSAIPLCRAASRILLQGVPAGISVDNIKEDIEELPGILSCHHLHVWQLSDTKLVASLHVQVEFDFKGEGSARYMALARAVRHCLHEYGIHSSTIQPEFCLDSEHRHTSTFPSEDGGGGNSVQPDGQRSKIASKAGSRAASMRSLPNACLLECGEGCGDKDQCCPPNTGEPDNDEHR